MENNARIIQALIGQQASYGPIGDPQIDALAAMIERQRQTARQQMQGPIDPYYLEQRRQMMPQQGMDERMQPSRPIMPRFEGYR